MRWPMAGGQAVLTFRALHKSGRFDLAWEILLRRFAPPANDNRPRESLDLAA